MDRISLSAALIVAGMFAAAGAARADYINLECSDNRQGDFYRHVGITYWIDLDKQTITYALVQDGELDPRNLWTYPVQITPAAFNFSAGQFTVNINRLTGFNTWNGPGGNGQPQTDTCSKGSRPFPAAKF
jgi:hypothetical protein